MDEDGRNEVQQSKRRIESSILFLGRFRFSRKKSAKVDRKHSLFSRSTFLSEKRTGIEPVIVDSDDKVHTKKHLKLKKSKSKKIHSDKSPLKYQSPQASYVESSEETCKEKVIRENDRRVYLVVDAPKTLHSGRKIDPTMDGSSQPSLPETSPKPNRTVLIPRSSRVRINPGPNLRENSRAGAEKPKKADEISEKRLDAVIGMSILMVTLLIMVMWGRLCAVLCTCAWLYFVPRLRVNHDFDKLGLGSGQADFSSEDYKKRVVLEGFLKRGHKTI